MFENIKEQFDGFRESTAGKVILGGLCGLLVVVLIVFVAGMRSGLRAEGDEIDAVDEGVVAAELMASQSSSAIRNKAGGVVSDIEWDTIEGYDSDGNPVYATRRTVPTVAGYDMCGAPLSDSELIVTGKTGDGSSVVFGEYSSVDRARERGVDAGSDSDIDWFKASGYDRDSNPIFVSKSGKVLGYDMLGNPLMPGSVTVMARTDSGLPLYEYSTIQTARAEGKNAQKELKSGDPEKPQQAEGDGKIVHDSDMGVRVEEKKEPERKVSVNRVSSIEGYSSKGSVSADRKEEKGDAVPNVPVATAGTATSSGYTGSTGSTEGGIKSDSTFATGSTGSTPSSESRSDSSSDSGSEYGSLSGSSGTGSSSSQGSSSQGSSSGSGQQGAAKETTYTVTFDPDNGKKDTVVTVKAGETVSKPSDPAKDGYVFKGWYLDDEKFSFSTKIEKNITLTAQYGREAYKVTFDWNKPKAMLEAENRYRYFTFPSASTYYADYGGTYGDSNSDFPGIGSDVDVYGYNFLGWYTGNTRVSEDTDVLEKAVTLTASWKPITYKVSFAKGTDTTGAAPVTDMLIQTAPSTYTVEEELKVPDPTAEGYTFLGWTYDGVKEPVKALVLPIGTTGNKNFVAHWRGNTVTVTYNANGGSGTMNHDVLTYAKGVTLSLNDYSFSGRIFSGWNTRKGGDGTWYTPVNGRIEADTALFTEDGGTVELFAQWQNVEYYVAFAGNNATSGDMPMQTFSYGVSQKLNACTFSKTGYLFSGWALSGTGEVLYKDEAGVSNLTDVPGETVTLYAVWTPVTYSVVFNSNSEKVTTLTQKMVYDAPSFLAANSFKYTGHLFRGWGSTPTQYEIDYTDKAQVSNLCAENGGSVSLFALWEVGTYRLSFDANGGTVSPESRMVVFGKPYGTLPVPDRNGYTFDGWTATNSKSGVKVTENTVMETEGATVYAQWTKDP